MKDCYFAPAAALRRFQAARSLALVAADILYPLGRPPLPFRLAGTTGAGVWMTSFRMRWACAINACTSRAISLR